MKERSAVHEPVRLRRILVTGASGGMGRALLERLVHLPVMIGAHAFRGAVRLRGLERGCHTACVKVLTGPLNGRSGAHALVDRFAKWAGGIDALVQLTGDVKRPSPWTDISERDWNSDLAVNLSGPFFAAQRAMALMKRGGRIVFSSTASAKHGGGRTSLAYGAAKAGIECVTKALARDGAPRGILVNAVAPGFIETPFHAGRMGRTPKQLRERAAMVPLGRAGTPEEAASVILFLLSSGADYVTGETIAVSGGDWL